MPHPAPRQPLVDQHLAEREVEAEGLHRLGEMVGQLGLDVELAAIGMIDADAAGMEVHLAADPAGQERFLQAIFAVADDRVADRGAMEAELVGPVCGWSSTQAVRLPA